MNVESAITFDTAEHEYNQAWSAPSSTRFELAPVEVNTVLKKRYRVSPERTLTRAMIWNMGTKKAWDPLSHIPYVVSQARSWGQTTLRDGSTRFSRLSLQRGWITSEEGLVLEEVFVSDVKQIIYFLGRPRMVEENSNTFFLQFCRRTFCSEFTAMVFSLLGFFFGMIAVFAAAVGTMIGLTNFSTSERVVHYPRSVVERDITATNREPRLFMVAPDTEDGSPTKNTEAAAVPAEKPDATKSKPSKTKLLSHQRNNYEQPGYGNARSYAQETRNGPRGLFFNW
jgi:hypothetical protein